MIIGGYGFGFNTISNLYQEDVNQNDIKQIENSMKQDKPLEQLGFNENFKVESTGNILSQNFAKTIAKFDFGISSLTNKINSLKQKLASLLKKKKKPWGLINSIKRQIKIYTKGLNNLKKLKAQHLRLKSKTEGQVSKNLSVFGGSKEAKDALYNRGAQLLSQFPNLQNDFRFLLTAFTISIPQEQINQNPFFNISIVGGDGLLSRISFISNTNLGMIMQSHDVNMLTEMLNSSFTKQQQLFRNLNILNRAEQFEIQKLLRLQMDLGKFSQASSFAKMRKMFFKSKEMLFRGFAKTLDFVSKAVSKMSIALENAANGLEAAANAAQAIPLVGPAVAAALRMAAKALRMAAKALKKAAHVLQQKSKLMQNKSNHMKQMQNLMDKKISFLEKLKNRVNEYIQQIREKLLSIRQRKEFVLRQMQFEQQLMQLIIMRLRMLGETPILPSMGLGLPGLGIPGAIPMGMPLNSLSNMPLGVPTLGMPSLGVLPIGKAGLSTIPFGVNAFNMSSMGFSFMQAGTMLSVVNPVIGLPLALGGGMLMLSSGLLMNRNQMFGGFLSTGFRSVSSTLGDSIMGGTLSSIVNNIYRPTNIKQQAEQLLTEFANQVINNSSNPMSYSQKIMLKQIYIQIAQRIELHPNVRQIVSRAVGEDLSHITPANSGMINGMIGGTLAGATIGLLIGGPAGAIIGGLTGAVSGGIFGRITGAIMGSTNSFVSPNSVNLLINYSLVL